MKSAKEIGSILKESREKKNLGIDKVYKATHIQHKVIKALEEGAADDILSRVYVLLFLKKYAYFLGLDGESLASEYKDIYKAAEKKREEEINVTEKQKPAIDIDVKKWVTIGISLALIFMFLFTAYVLGMKLRSLISTKQGQGISRPGDVIPVAKEKAIEDTAQSLFPLREDRPIQLTLRAEDKSWVRVKTDGDTSFEGMLEKNTSRDWSGEREIEVKIGKPEALDFIINGNSIGKIDKPNVKTVYISREGIKTGNKWLYSSGE